VRIAAAGDIHGGEFLEPFVRAIRDLPEVDVFVLAGDITDHNNEADFDRVLEAVTAKVSCPILAVFGNNEYPSHHEGYRARHRATFLESEAHVVESGGERLRFVGTSGSLDEPTWWQRNNLPNIWREYAQRVEAVDRLLQVDEPTVLLTHYPPTHVTMGEEKEAWRSQLGSLRMEAVVKRRRPLAVIHGHVHKGIPYGEIGGGQSTLEDFTAARGPIPVYNVAVPVSKGITLLEYRDGQLLPLRR